MLRIMGGWEIYADVDLEEYFQTQSAVHADYHHYLADGYGLRYGHGCTADNEQGSGA